MDFSGTVFRVDYRLGVSLELVRPLAEKICYEQTVELPEDLLPSQEFKEKVVGKIISIRTLGNRNHIVSIEFPIELTGLQLVQMLNVVYGNCSMFGRVKVVGLELPPLFLEQFKGPRFGREGVRRVVGAEGRSLFTSALKPQGASGRELAHLAGELASGGVDIIKDDHGLADQPFCRFEERVKRCGEAIQNSNAKTGFRTIYAPHISGTIEGIVARARFAKEAGAGGVMVAPGLVGWDTLRMVAGDDDLKLITICHPAFLGSYVTSTSEGISPDLLFGTLPRLAGGDLTIFTHHGGRFSLSRRECRGIAVATGKLLGDLKPSFPMPGGGMTVERVPELIDFYRGEVAILVAGGIHYGRGSITERCLSLREMLSK